MNAIKTHAYVSFEDADAAASALKGLHGLKWPATSTKTLSCKLVEVSFAVNCGAELAVSDHQRWLLAEQDQEVEDQINPPKPKPKPKPQPKEQKEEDEEEDERPRRRRVVDRDPEDAAAA